MSDPPPHNPHSHEAHRQHKQHAHQPHAPSGSHPPHIAYPAPLNRSTNGQGCWLALVCYFLLSFLSPLALHVPVWLGLAFGLIPLLVGFVATRGAARVTSDGARFRNGFRAGCIPAWFYAAINLIIVHARMGESPSPGGAFLVGFVVAIAYALLAGCMAGLAGRLLLARSSRAGEGA